MHRPTYLAIGYISLRAVGKKIVGYTYINTYISIVQVRFINY